MLKQKFLVSIISELLIYLIGFISLIIIVRILGPKPIGIINSALAIGNLVSIIGNLGFGVLHVKLVSQGENLDECISSFLIIKLFTIPLMVLVYLIYSFLFPHNSLSLFGFENKAVIIIILIAIVISSLNDIGNFTLSAQLQIAKGKLVLLIQKFISSIGKIIVALLSLSVVFLAATELVAILFSSILYIFFFKHVRLKYPNKSVFEKYFKLSIPSFVITLTSILMSNNIDRVIIANYAGTDEVGYYSVSLSLMIFFSFLANNLNNILYPRFSNLFANNQISEVVFLSRTIEKFILLLIFPLTSIFLFSSKEIVILLFGVKLVYASDIVSFLSLQYFILLLSKPFSTQLIGSGNFNLVMKLDLLLISITIILLVILVPAEIFGIKVFGLGGVGAAISLLISYTILFFCYRLYTKKLFKTEFIFKNYIPVILNLTLNLILIVFLRNKIKDEIIYLLLSICINFPIYFLLVITMKLMSKYDFKVLNDLFDLKVLKNYIKFEFKEV